MTLARLMVVLSLNSAGFRSGLMAAIAQTQQLQRTMGGMVSGQALSSLGRGLTYGLTVPLLAASVAIGTLGSQLTEQMGRVQSVIASPGNMQSSVIAQWTDDVQRLGVQLGRTSPEVAGALYEIVSAFGKLPNTTEFLEIAGRTAVAGQSDLVTSAKNLSLAVRAWGDSSSEAVQHMADLALQTVKVGTLTEHELGGALSNVLPVAKLYGVRLEEVFAGLSSLSGVSGTASQASTQLARAITSLVAPNTTLTKLYKANGIASGEALIAQKGLLGAFQEVARISETTGTPLQKMLGRLEAVKAVASLTGPQMETFTEHLAGLADAAGAVDVAFAGTTQGIDSAAFQWAQGMQRLRAIAEDLYIAFAPAVGNVADSLAPIGKAFEGLAQAVAQMDTDTLTTVVYVLLGLAALGPVLTVVGSLSTLFSGLSTVLMAVNPWVWAVAAAGGALWLAWSNNWGGIQEGVYGLFDGIRERAENTKQAIGNLQEKWKEFNNPTAKAADGSGPAATLRDVGKAIGEVWTALGPAKSELSHFEQQMIDSAPKVQSAWDTFWGGFADNWPDFSQLGADIGALWTSITTGAQGAGAGVTSGINGPVMGVGLTFQSMSSTATSNMNKIPPAAKTAASGAKGAFTSVGWPSVGSGIASGIASGITSGASWIASAAKSAASAALTSAKAVLGIKSPSSVMALQVGLPIAQGMALGIARNAYLVNQAMRALLPPGYNYESGIVTGGGRLAAAASYSLAGGGSVHTTNEITFGDIIVNGGTEEAGGAVVASITQALQKRGLM